MQTVIDHGGGKKTFFAQEDGNFIAGTSQDCTPILEYVKALKAAGITGSSEVKFAGKIPDVVVEDYCNRNGIDFATFIGEPIHVKRLLNDPDYRDLRIWEGRI